MIHEEKEMKQAAAKMDYIKAKRLKDELEKLMKQRGSSTSKST